MAAKTITILGEPIRKEGKANAAITPGHLVERMSTGNIRVHATAAGNQGRIFALEDDLQGNEIADAYAANDRVQLGVFPRGAEVNAILTTSQTVVIGDLLESAGDGTLRKMSLDSTGTYFVEQVVGVATEAVTTTGTVARIIVEIY